MPEVLIVMAATLVVFLFLLLVLYIRGRRDQNRTRLPKCAQCNCDRKGEIAPGQSALKVGEKP